MWAKVNNAQLGLELGLCILKCSYPRLDAVCCPRCRLESVIESRLELASCDKKLWHKLGGGL